MTRAAWLEAHDEFEGVGAHEINPRYDPIDDGEHDGSIAAVPHLMPALFAARGALMRAATVTAVRFDGADISHHQHDAGPVDEATLFAASNGWFAFKLTQSTKYRDPTAQRSRLAARKAKVRNVGLYHWLSSTTDPEEQAWWYLKNIGGDRLTEHEFAMCDTEEAGVTVDKNLGFMEAVEKREKRSCADYTGGFVAGGTIWRDPRIREGKYGPRPMILAAYTTEARAKQVSDFARFPWSSWQYSSNGPVPGITGRCDMNRVDDFAIYDLASGLGVVQPPPIETDPVVVPPVHTPGTTEDEEPVAFIARSQTKGMALVSFCITNDNVASYRMAGLEGDVAQLATMGPLVAQLPVVDWPDDIYLTRAAAAYRG